MKTLLNVVESIRNISEVCENELCNEIIEAFEDYNVEGETEVIFSSTNSTCFKVEDGEHCCYINHKDSYEIDFELDEIDKGIYTVSDAWVLGIIPPKIYY